MIKKDDGASRCSILCSINGLYVKAEKSHVFANISQAYSD